MVFVSAKEFYDRGEHYAKLKEFLNRVGAFIENIDNPVGIGYRDIFHYESSTIILDWTRKEILTLKVIGNDFMNTNRVLKNLESFFPKEEPLVVSSKENG